MFLTKIAKSFAEHNIILKIKAFFYESFYLLANNNTFSIFKQNPIAKQIAPKTASTPRHPELVSGSHPNLKKFTTTKPNSKKKCHPEHCRRVSIKPPNPIAKKMPHTPRHPELVSGSHLNLKNQIN